MKKKKKKKKPEKHWFLEGLSDTVPPIQEEMSNQMETPQEKKMME